MSTGLLSQLETYYTQIDEAQSPIRSDEVTTRVDSPVRVTSVSRPSEQGRAWLVGVAIAVVVLVGGTTWFLGAAGSDSPSGPPPAIEDPAADLAAYEDARNAEDVDALIALYANDAVVIGHPLDEDGLAEGVDEIRTLESHVPAIHGANGFTEYGEIEVSGNTATFKQKLVNNEGDCFSSSGNETTVADDKITLYQWGDDEDDQCG
jgi:hypothetical protein